MKFPRLNGKSKDLGGGVGTVDILVISQVKIFSPILIRICCQFSHLKNKNVSLSR